MLILFVENGRKWKNYQFSNRKIIISIIKFLKNPRRDHPDPAPDGRGRGRGAKNTAGRVGVRVGVRKKLLVGVGVGVGE